MSDSPKRVFVGTLVQCSIDRHLEVVENAAIEVDKDGFVISVTALDSLTSTEYLKSNNVTILPTGSFLVPGLIDLHYHAPQLPQAGTNLHIPLHDWLTTTTLPLEAKYANTQFAETVFEKVVKRTLGHGTTTAVYFATKHRDSAKILASCCIKAGQRALVGKVCMDNKDMCLCTKESVCTCTETTTESIHETRTFLEEMASLTKSCNSRVEPVVTPRFVPSCSPHLLTQLGSLSQEFNAHVQSHAWENDWQVEYGEQNRNGRDLDLFQTHNLISKQGTVFAHSVHANDSEIKQLARHQIGVAHCPLSNAFFANGIMPARLMLEAGVPVGLGTDVGGAWSSSILDSCRQAVTSSRILRDGVGKLRGAGNGPCSHPAEINHVDAFWMATVGGGLALKKKIGRIAPGYKFDALVVDVHAPNSNIDSFDSLVDTIETKFQKFVYLGDDRNIRQVYVDGICVLDKQ